MEGRKKGRSLGVGVAVAVLGRLGGRAVTGVWLSTTGMDLSMRHPARHFSSLQFLLSLRPSSLAGLQMDPMSMHAVVDQQGSCRLGARGATRKLVPVVEWTGTAGSQGKSPLQFSLNQVVCASTFSFFLLRSSHAVRGNNLGGCSLDGNKQRVTAADRKQEGLVL
ncbi:uncharacterized protein B0T23DRAFT_133317 [Neurospora hispaniola]|uniref:Uncharacterized protein n=1 Tax=Neurospora hispaniola TaxID=588809 RepID=A0AAJ0I737_9PEZI|nr:hypothetical protein B0T23DRAFT_133317 [Neurospora hispaniola]